MDTQATTVLMDFLTENTEALLDFMINLTTQYLGLELKNPIIAGSSGLTSTAELEIPHTADCQSGLSSAEGSEL